MRFSHLALNLLICCVVTIPGWTVEMTPLDKYLPADCVLYLGLDLDTLSELNDTTQADELLADPPMRTLMDEFEAWWNTSVTDQFSLLESEMFSSGKMAAGVQFGLVEEAKEGTPPFKTRICVVLDDADQEVFQQLGGLMPALVGLAQAQGMSTGKISGGEEDGDTLITGNDLFVLDSSLALGHSEGVTTLSVGYRWSSEEYVTSVLEGKVGKSLTTTPSHRKALTGAGKGMFSHSWMDVPSVVQTALAGLDGLGMSIEDGEKVMKHLGVDNLGLLSASSSVDGGAYEGLIRVRMSGKPHGLMDLVTRPMDMQILQYAPVNNSSFQGFGHAPIREIVAFILDFVQDMSGDDPRPGYEEGLASAKEDGIDIEKDLFDTIGSTKGFAVLAEGGALLTTLADAERFDNTLTKTIAQGGDSVPLRPASYKGINYRVFLLPLMGLQPCGGVVENAFVLATSPGALHKIIDTAQSEDSMSNNEWFKSRLEPKSEQIVYFQCNDANGFLNQLNLQADFTNMAAGMAGGPGAGLAAAQKYDTSFAPGAYPDGMVMYRSGQGFEAYSVSSAMFPLYITLVNTGRQIAQSGRGQHGEGSLARRAREKAEQEAAAQKVGTGDPEKDLELIAKAVETYQARSGNYPSELSALVPDYIAGIPNDPNGMEGYRYYTNGIVYYILAANGPDGDADVVVRSYRGSYENDRSVRGKIYKPDSDSSDGDVVRFGPAY